MAASFLPHIAAVALALTSGQAHAAPIPPNSLLMLWAAWCAPCRVEVAEFERLSAAAKPRSTIVLALDDAPSSRALLASLPPERLRLTTETLPALYRRLGIGGPVALPVSLMTDAQGRICATIRGGATIARIALAQETCAARAQAAKR